jgi:hypothetical protein
MGVSDITDSVNSYFSELTQLQQYAWMATALGILLIAAAFILG